MEPWGLVCRAWQTVKGLEGPILESSSVRATASVDRDRGLLTPTLVALRPSSILGFPFQLTWTQVQAPVTHPGPQSSLPAEAPPGEQAEPGLQRRPMPYIRYLTGLS